MIYLDSIGLNFLAKEFENEIKNFKVNKIVQYDNNTFSLFFSKKQLFFQLKGNDSIVYLKNNKEEANNFSCSFLLSLKKYLDHAELIACETLNDDRVIQFTFNRINISGNMDVFYLIFEMMGLHSNIFLLNEKREIINILNNKYSIENKRFYSIGSNYELFETVKQRIDFESIYEDENDMISKVAGIGKIFAKDTFNDLEKRKYLYSTCKPIIAENDSSFTLSYNAFSKFNRSNIEQFSSLNEALNTYFTKYINISLIKNLKNELQKHLKKQIKKNEKILDNIQKDLEASSNYERFKHTGDLIAANMYLIKPRSTSIEVLDYETNENVLIELDPNKSASDIMNVYYNRYRKAKKSIVIAKERQISIEEEIEYLNSTLDFLEMENEYLGILEIKEELGLEKAPKNIKQKKKKRDLLKYVVDDFEIFVGRNHSENNFLTFEKAKNHDIWLHVRDIPGSHVIIVTNKKDVPKNVLYEAAKLAGLHSKGMGKKIIDYTERNNVKRTNKLGNVTFQKYNSIEI